MVVCYTAVFRVVTGEERCVTTLKKLLCSRPGEWENDKFVTKQRMGIEVAVRALLQVRFFVLIFHFPVSRSTL